MVAVLTVCAALLVSAAVLALRHLAGVAGARAFAAVLTLHMIGLVALGALVWKVFWGLEEGIVTGEADVTTPPVVVLQDRSTSMEMPGNAWRTRNELADGVWNEVRQRCRGITGSTPVERYFFARDLVEESGATHLDRSDSRLGRAFSQLLSRETPRSLLVVSDGAASDGIAPPYLLDWARNRGIRVHAICATFPDNDPFDRAIENVACEPVNPTSVQVRVRGTGDDPRPLHVTLSVDGTEIARVQRTRMASQEVSFRVPAFDEGWHEFRVNLEPVEGEATVENNLYHGVFRVSRARRMLFLHDRPRIENVHLARILKRRFESSLVPLPVSRWQQSGLEARDFALVILADVAPDRIPGGFADACFQSRTALMVLAGEHLEAWARLLGDRFPIAGDVQPRNLTVGAGRGAFVRKSPDVAGRAGRLADLAGELRLDLLHGAERRAGATTLYDVVTGNTALPLLVADSTTTPTCLVLLADTTWKWARHPERRVRRAYEDWWFGCIDWLSRSDGKESPLVLELEDPGEGSNEVRGWLVPAPSHRDAKLRDCRITITSSAGVTHVTTVPQHGRHTFQRQVLLDSGILWVQGSATLDGRPVSTPRVPVARHRELAELRNLQADPALLRRYTTREENTFAGFPDREPVLDSLVRADASTVSEYRTRSRDSFWELLLATLVVMAFAGEWWLERRLFVKGVSS